PPNCWIACRWCASRRARNWLKRVAYCPLRRGSASGASDAREARSALSPVVASVRVALVAGQDRQAVHRRRALGGDDRDFLEQQAELGIDAAVGLVDHQVVDLLQEVEDRLDPLAVLAREDEVL